MSIKVIGYLMSIILIPISFMSMSLAYDDLLIRQAANSGISITSYYWEKIDIPPGISYYSLAVHPNDAYTVLMGTSNGIFKTTDAGDSWTRMENSPEGGIFEITISQSNPNRIFEKYYASFYRSDDGGDSWTHFALPTNCGLKVAPSDADRIYCRKYDFNEEPSIFRSNDGGETWITPNVSYSNRLLDLAIAPDNPDILVAFDYNGIYKSIDGGITWEKSLIINQSDGKLIFDPTPPHLLYLGNPVDLFRSQDYGESWEVSGLYGRSTAFGISPFSINEIIGATDYSGNGWRIQSGRYTWSLTTWSTPKKINSFLISNDDDRAIYAAGGDGLWRYIRRTRSWPHVVHLPIIENDNDTYSIPNSAVQAIERSNFYREQIGIPSIILNSNLVSAAQNHADYHTLNYKDPSAWINGPHGEVTGKPGFTGENVPDRMNAAGYQWGSGFEVIAYDGDPIYSVDHWMSTVYHREPFLDPFFKYAGYGIGRENRFSVDVMDFGGGPPQGNGNWVTAQPPLPQAYPVDGQTGVPTKWDGAENPDPLPPGASLPVGYPFTLFGTSGLLQYYESELRDSNGNLVPIHPNPSDCQSHCIAVIPVSPLRPNETYTVRVSGNVSNLYEFDRTWSFTTGSE